MIVAVPDPYTFVPYNIKNNIYIFVWFQNTSKNFFHGLGKLMTIVDDSDSDHHCHDYDNYGDDRYDDGRPMARVMM